MIIGKNDHPGYSCKITQWVLITGVGPLNFWPARVAKRIAFDGMKPMHILCKFRIKVLAKSLALLNMAEKENLIFCDESDTSGRFSPISMVESGFRLKKSESFLCLLGK
ncbi:MAG: hypothetical protein ACKOHM_08365 [Spartobacteria bacterium]